MRIALRARVSAALLAVACAAVSYADDQIIFQRSNLTLGSGGGPTNSAAIVLAVNEPGAEGGDGYTTEMFDLFFLTNQEQGATASVDASNDPDFAHIADIFTNGINNKLVWIGVEHYPGVGFSGGGSSESEFFFNDPDGATGSDLHGFQINRIQLTLDRFSIANPGS